MLRELLLPTPQGPLDAFLSVAAAIDDLPLDVNIPPDGDDSLLANPGSAAHIAAISREGYNLPPTRAGHLVVPYRRALRGGDTGRDVIAVQRALRAAKVRTQRPTGLYGSRTIDQVAAFQKAHTIAPQTGLYGPKTHKKMLPFFDAYGAWLMGGGPSAAPRARVVAAALLGYAHRAQMHYTQGPHRMDGVNLHLFPPHYPLWADCSAFATWCYYAAKVPDPNGFGYNGTGYTGTLDKHGKVVSLAQAQPGDLCFYGNGDPWEHVTIYIGSGRCVSMGSDPGPFILPVAYRPVGQVRSYL